MIETSDRAEWRTQLPDTKIIEIVDGKATPRTVYHGTHRNFKPEDFDRLAQKGRRKGNALDFLGAWWSSNPEAAKIYGPKILRAKLNIKNPHIIRGKDAWAKLKMEADKVGSVEAYRGRLIEMGFDGVWLQGSIVDGIEQDVYVSFINDQIWPAGPRVDQPAQTAKRRLSLS